ncbi:MAG: selenide, water dikinase SelD [Hyphomicrobiaceae bacterium]
MQAQSNMVPARTHIVLVGGGHAHVTVLRDFAMKPEPGVVITLVTREIDAPYSGMLPGYVAGHYSYDECHIDVIRLATWGGMRFIHGEVTAIDRANRQIEIAGRTPLSYDLLSIDVGITPDTASIAGAAEHALAVKPVSLFADKWRALEQAALQPQGPRHIAVVGSGAAGFELILAIRHRMRTAAGDHGIDAEAFRYTLIGSGGLLPSHNARARTLARKELERQSISFVSGERVTALEADHVVLQSGRRLDVDAVLLTTNARPSPWFRASGLPLDEQGFIAVRPTLQLTDDDDVFAAGDCATVLQHRREKAGVFAVRQGPPLTENLRLRARGRPARPFVPQRDFLTILSTGGEHAIAARNGLAIRGHWVWRWKDRIDREFMAMFNDLDGMSRAAAVMPFDGDDDAMRCGGGASKIGPVTLARALDRVAVGSAATRDDAALLDDGRERIRLETIDFFRAFWPEPYVFGEVAAAHAMSDVFAMGGQPTHALANIVLPYAEPSRVEDDLVQVLAGAKAAFARDGVTIVGGHSSEGAELAAGFFVSGEVERQHLLAKRGLRAGDKLILTRPVGTGILFAGLMRTLARGHAVNTALVAMRRSNRLASQVLAEMGASAATDVTGFGLAGHLIEMLDGSQKCARLDLQAVPLYPTVLELARAGLTSSLLAENVRVAGRLDGAAAHDPAVRAILFDPQTSGGLLAGVAAADAERVLAALHAAGVSESAIIGDVVDRIEGVAVPTISLIGSFALGEPCR